MAENKTQKNNGSVAEFIASAEPSARREDLQQVVDMMHKITGLEPDMWGDSIIGFGSYAYRYESGRAAEWFLVGCSPRKQALTLYLMAGHERFLTSCADWGNIRLAKPVCTSTNWLM